MKTNNTPNPSNYLSFDWLYFHNFQHLSKFLNEKYDATLISKILLCPYINTVLQAIVMYSMSSSLLQYSWKANHWAMIR